MEREKVQSDTMFIACEVEKGVDIRSRLCSVHRYARKHVRTHAPSTHVYVRLNRGLPDAVVLALENTKPEQHRHYIAYVDAELWLSSSGRYETLDTQHEAA